MAEYNSVTVSAGAGGFGGPLVLTPTEKKNKIVNITGGVISPVSLRLGEILFGTYITATDDSSFYLIDQHAAHERVNYERFVGAYLSSEKLSQLLLIPFTCDVPREMAADDAEWTGILRDMGYAVENFGENTYIFREIPQFVTLEEAEGFVHTFVDSFMEGIRLNNRVVIDKLITKS